jgi:glycerate kinase
MAVALFTQWPAGPAATAQRVAERINQRLGGQAPAGGICHAEGPTADGGWWTFNVRVSAEAVQRFHQEVLHPVLDEVGASRGQVQHLQVSWDTSQMPS